MSEYTIRDHDQYPTKSSLSRRDFLGLAAVSGVGLLPACSLQKPIDKSSLKGYPELMEKDYDQEARDLTEKWRQEVNERLVREQTPGANEYDASGAWRIDFSTMQDGPLVGKWNVIEGRIEADWNAEEQAYTGNSRNVRIENGALVIQSQVESTYGKNYTSARIDTRGIFDFKYGELNVVAQLPQGVGTWPAGWLMPSNPIYNAQELGVPSGAQHEFAVNGEIDFLEAIGRHPGENIPAAHTFGQLNKSTIYTPGRVPTMYDEYHSYGVIKTPGRIQFTIDGTVYTEREQTSDDPLWWPFEQKYYLILNLAMGGSWAGAEKRRFPPDGIDRSKQEHWKYQIREINFQPV